MDTEPPLSETASAASDVQSKPVVHRTSSDSSENKRRKNRDEAEVLREQEVYKYATVFNSMHVLPNSTSIRIAPDFTLQTFAHIIALKTGIEHCMFTLLDSRSQYVIAEAGLDTPAHVDMLDNPLLGSAMMSREIAVCDLLICADPELKSPPKPMIIPDLAVDERLKTLPYVVNAPHLRFYAGVAICNPTDFCIGTIIVMSSRPNPPFGDAQLSVLQDMAPLVVNHLEFQRTTENHRRGERMVKGLSLFVAGKSTIEDLDEPIEIHMNKFEGKKETEKARASRRSRSRAHSHDKIDKLIPKRSRIPNLTASTADASTGELKTGHSRTLGNADTKGKEAAETVPKKQDVQVPSSVKSLFDRASRILSESLEVDIAFFDAAIGSFGGYIQSSARLRHRRPPARKKKSENSSQEADRVAADSADETSAETDSTESPPRTLSFSSNSSLAYTSVGTDEQRNSTLLGFTAGHLSSLDQDSPPDSLSEMKESFLQKLLRRYPQGRVFNLETLAVMSSEDDSGTGQSDTQPLKMEHLSEEQLSRLQRRQRRIEATQLKSLRNAFPDARAVLFCPLWDYQRERWFCAGFAYSKNPFRVLTNQEDLNFITCFGNSIMSEVARLDAVNSDLAKTSFISSMSHELRSPLHGILASSELLRETASSGYQIDLISSIDRCGAILLDSINHVLDFTKINTILSSKSGKPQFTKSEGIDSLLRDIDLSVLIEESMEGIFSGFSHRNLFNKEDWLSKGDNSPPENHTTIAKESNVFCILDIDWRLNWIFHTQPGAWTRIIVNLFGNALKYTGEGFIKVSLRARSPRETSSTSGPMIVDLIVSDSGQGMSHEFLRSRLFRPFSQENNLATGTGLGLSIVSQLVTALGGTIDVRSELSFGTDFRISARLNETNHPATQDDGDPQPMSLANQVRQRTKGRKLCVVGFSKLEDDADIDDIPAVAKAKCLLSVESSFIAMSRDWFGMEVTTCKEMNQASGDIVMVYESELIAGEERRQSVPSPAVGTPGFGIAAPLIIVCRSRKSFEKHSKENSSALKTNSQSIIELIPLPCGPHKFARVLALCLDRMESAASGIPTDYFSIPHSPTEEEKGGITPRPRDIGSPQSRVPAEKSPGAAQRTIETTIARQSTLQKVTEDRVVTFQDSETSESEDSSTTDSEVETDDSSTRGPRILLVDDNEINLRLLETRIKRDGYDYETAIHGESAVEVYKAARGNFDIIFMDLSMPVMDGMEATRLIRKYEEQQRVRPAVVVALTGLGSEQAQTDAFGVGINLFLMKPASFQKVRAVIADWVENHNRA